MQNFFNSALPAHGGNLRPPSWNYVKNGLQRNLETAKAYYYNRPFAVKSSHFLARLLNSIGVSHDTNLERYYDIVDTKSLTLSMTFKMTSSLYRGSVFKGTFYGTNNPEILIGTNDSFDPYWVDKNWKSVSAVTPLAHPYSDLDLLLPNGRDTSTGEGVAVVAINIPMLAVQYRAFTKQQYNNKIIQGESPLGVAQFIHMYVLPNMLDQQLDIALFNRALNLSNGAPMGIGLVRHPFFLTNYSKNVDDVYKPLIQYCKQTNLDYKEILTQFPGVTNEDFFDLMRLPESAATRQIFWAEIVARLDALEFMMNLSIDSGVVASQQHLNYFLRTLRLYQNDRTLESAMPADMLYDVRRKVDNIRDRVSSFI